MTKGVLYFNRGTKCLTRLSVSLRSLRKYYDGPVAIAYDGPVESWFRKIADKFKASFIEFPKPKENEYVLTSKSRLWRLSPFDVTVFLDADTLILVPINELFEGAIKQGAVVTKFCDWVTTGRTMRRRIEAWKVVAPEMIRPAIDYGWAVNTGVIAWVKGSPLMPAYEQLTERGNKHRSVARKTLDEIAMQILLPAHSHWLAGQEWNCSGTHARAGGKIMHYHGNKHCRRGPSYDLWKNEFRALVDDMKKELPEAVQPLEESDNSVAKWLMESKGYRPDMTIVTAVNPPYADRAKANIEKWMNTPGLKEQQFIVFVNGFSGPKERAFLNRPNIKVIKWNYPFDGASPRETMLASFILGVAEHVKTPHWMKLDCDTKPIAGRWDWPRYRRNTITSHKWGYTKIKADPNVTEHWFTKLDRLFADGNPVFKLPLDPVKDLRVGHRKGNPHGIPMRFGSFAHIEKTDFTRRVAKLVREKCGGRLPIPSQDTLVWYLATLWKEPVKLMNMKEWFIP